MFTFVQIWRGCCRRYCCRRGCSCSCRCSCHNRAAAADDLGGPQNGCRRQGSRRTLVTCARRDGKKRVTPSLPRALRGNGPPRGHGKIEQCPGWRSTKFCTMAFTIDTGVGWAASTMMDAYTEMSPTAAVRANDGFFA